MMQWNRPRIAWATVRRSQVSDETSEQPERTDQTFARQEAPDAPARLRKKAPDPAPVQPASGVRRKAGGKKGRSKRATHGEPSGGGGADWH
jgi:hypothetical protein